MKRREAHITKWELEDYYLLEKRTILEISKITLLSPNQIRYFLRFYKIPLRMSSISKLGEKNGRWTGNKVKTRQLHQWVEEHKIKTGFCEDCHKNESEVGILDLANISGEYKRDVNDFKWQCRGCHIKSDGRVENNLLHTVPNNVIRDVKGKFVSARTLGGIEH